MWKKRFEMGCAAKPDAETRVVAVLAREGNDYITGSIGDKFKGFPGAVFFGDGCYTKKPRKKVSEPLSHIPVG